MKLILIIFVLTILADRESYPISENNSVLLPLTTYMELNERNIVMKAHPILLNHRFGRLITIALAGRDKYNKKMVSAVCDCGTVRDYIYNSLRIGHTQSCGCLPNNKPKHGHNTRAGKSPEYKVWDAMIQRCTNPNHNHYKHYGGRGISICDNWKDFVKFFSDMGKKPFLKAQIDRIDNNGNYEPSNCRWTDHKTNARNSSQTILTVNEVKQIKQLISETTLTRKTIGEIFDVSKACIVDIGLGRRWADV